MVITNLTSYKIGKTAVFLLKTALFRTLPPFFPLLMGENGHFFNFYFEGGYHRMSKNCTNFAHYNSDRTNDPLFCKTISAFEPVNEKIGKKISVFFLLKRTSKTNIIKVA